VKHPELPACPECQRGASVQAIGGYDKKTQQSLWYFRYVCLDCVLTFWVKKPDRLRKRARARYSQRLK